MKFYLIISLSLFFLTVSCTKQITKQTVSQGDKTPIYYNREGDTATYVFTFPDKKDKKNFTKDFKTFLKNYPFENITVDTIDQYFKVRIIPEKRDTSDRPSLSIPYTDTTEFTETDIADTQDISAEDTIRPAGGGKATIYSSRRFMDYTLSELLRVIPFSENQADTVVSQKDIVSFGFLNVTRISALKIKVQCTENLVNRDGRHLTAFDIVQAWTDLIKNNPAEGLALFGPVKGIKKFTKGEEGIIQGFAVANDKTIRITLSRPDPYILQRLYSLQLLPSSLSIGPFYLKKQQGNRYILQSNPRFPFNKPFLDHCTVICGNDKNPIITYSLNKYDVVLLYEKKDLEYAQRSLIKNSHLIPYATDRYFISLASRSAEVRKGLAGLIDPAEIKANAVKGEGEVIAAIQSSGQSAVLRKNNPKAKNLLASKSITILFNADDPASVSIAEKIFSDLSHAGISGKLNGLQNTSLEIALTDRAYDIAIGWVPEKVLTDETQRLRLASIWFNGLYDETRRISEGFEIPLFTVNQYALCKKHIQFYKDTFLGIYRQEN